MLESFNAEFKYATLLILDLIRSNIMATTPSRVVQDGLPLIVGTADFGAVAPNVYENMAESNAITVDVVSATSAAVITVRFNRGNGFNNPKDVPAGTSESFFEPGVRAVELTNVGEDANVVVGFSTREPR